MVDPERKRAEGKEAPQGLGRPEGNAPADRGEEAREE